MRLLHVRAIACTLLCFRSRQGAVLHNLQDDEDVVVAAALEHLDIVLVSGFGADPLTRSSDLPALTSRLCGLFSSSFAAKLDWRRQVGNNLSADMSFSCLLYCCFKVLLDCLQVLLLRCLCISHVLLDHPESMAVDTLSLCHQAVEQVLPRRSCFSWHASLAHPGVDFACRVWNLCGRRL